MDQVKVLLVDDEERFLKTTARFLEKKGFCVQTAVNGAKALDVLKLMLIHVMVLDVQMPILDGFETLKISKKHHPSVEIIMLTGHATVEAAVEGLKTGVFDYLMKPVDLDDLVLKISAAHLKYQQTQQKKELAQIKNIIKPMKEIMKDMK